MKFVLKLLVIIITLIVVLGLLKSVFDFYNVHEYFESNIFYPLLFGFVAALSFCHHVFTLNFYNHKIKLNQKSPLIFTIGSLLLILCCIVFIVFLIILVEIKNSPPPDNLKWMYPVLLFISGYLAVFNSFDLYFVNSKKTKAHNTNSIDDIKGL